MRLTLLTTLLLSPLTLAAPAPEADQGSSIAHLAAREAHPNLHPIAKPNPYPNARALPEPHNLADVIAARDILESREPKKSKPKGNKNSTTSAAGELVRPRLVVLGGVVGLGLVLL